jgi:hypothetical protein
MKLILLKELHYLARHTSCDDFIQYVKKELTGEPITTVINCDPVVVDKNELIDETVINAR